MPKKKPTKVKIEEPKNYERLYETASDVGEEYFPFLTNTLRNFRQAHNDVEEWVKTSTPFRRNPGGSTNEKRIARMAGNIYEGFRRDIKEFRLLSFQNLNEEIEKVIEEAQGKGFDDSYDADSEDYDYSSFDTFKAEDYFEGTAINAKATVGAVSAATETLADVQFKTTDYASKRIVAGTNVAISRVLKFQAASADIMNAVNNNMVSLVESVRKTESFHSQALSFFERTESSFNDIKKLLEESADPEAYRENKALERKYSKNTEDKDYITGGFDVGKWAKVVWNDSMLGQLGKMLLGTAEPILGLFGVDVSKLTKGGMGGGGWNGITPIKDFIDRSPLVMQLQDLNESMEGLVKNFFIQANNKQVRTGNANLDELINGLGQFGFFKYDAGNENPSIRTGNYDKGVAKLTGITKKAIEEVIPEYLSSIENDLHALVHGFDTGQFSIGTFQDTKVSNMSADEKKANREKSKALKYGGEYARHYDYDEGKWKTYKQIEKEFLDSERGYLDTSFSEINNLIAGFLDPELHTDAHREEFNAFNKAMSDFETSIAKNGDSIRSLGYLNQFRDILAPYINKDLLASEKEADEYVYYLFNKMVNSKENYQKEKKERYSEYGTKGIQQRLVNKLDDINSDPRFSGAAGHRRRRQIDKEELSFNDYFEASTGDYVQVPMHIFKMFDDDHETFQDKIKSLEYQKNQNPDKAEALQQQLDALQKLYEDYKSAESETDNAAKRKKNTMFNIAKMQYESAYNDILSLKDKYDISDIDKFRDSAVVPILELPFIGPIGEYRSPFKTSQIIQPRIYAARKKSYNETRTQDQINALYNNTNRQKLSESSIMYEAIDWNGLPAFDSYIEKQRAIHEAEAAYNANPTPALMDRLVAVLNADVRDIANANVSDVANFIAGNTSTLPQSAASNVQVSSTVDSTTTTSDSESTDQQSTGSDIDSLPDTGTSGNSDATQSSDSNGSTTSHLHHVTTAGERAHSEDAPAADGPVSLSTQFRGFRNSASEHAKTWTEQAKALQVEQTQLLRRSVGLAENQRVKFFGQNGLFSNGIFASLGTLKMGKDFLFGTTNEDGERVAGVLGMRAAEKYDEIAGRIGVKASAASEAKEEAKRAYLEEAYGEDFVDSDEYWNLPNHKRLKEHQDLHVSKAKLQVGADGYVVDTYDYSRVAQPCPYSKVYIDPAKGDGWIWDKNRGFWVFHYKYNGNPETIELDKHHDYALRNDQILPPVAFTNECLNYINRLPPPEANDIDADDFDQMINYKPKMSGGAIVDKKGRFKGYTEYDYFDNDTTVDENFEHKTVVENGVEYELVPMFDKKGNPLYDKFGQVRVMGRKKDPLARGERFKTFDTHFDDARDARRTFLSDLHEKYKDNASALGLDANTDYSDIDTFAADLNGFTASNIAKSPELMELFDVKPMEIDNKVYLIGTYEMGGIKYSFNAGEIKRSRTKKTRFHHHGKDAIVEHFSTTGDDAVSNLQFSYYDENDRDENGKKKSKLDRFISRGKAKTDTAEEYEEFQKEMEEAEDEEKEYKAERKRRKNSRRNIIAGILIGNLMGGPAGAIVGGLVGSGAVGGPLAKAKKAIFGEIKCRDYIKIGNKKIGGPIGKFLGSKFVKTINNAVLTVTGAIAGFVLSGGNPAGALIGGGIMNRHGKEGGLFNAIFGGKDRKGVEKRGLLGKLWDGGRKADKKYTEATKDGGILFPLLGGLLGLSSGLGPLGAILGYKIARGVSTVGHKAFDYFDDKSANKKIKRRKKKKKNVGNGFGISEGFGPLDYEYTDEWSDEFDDISQLIEAQPVPPTPAPPPTPVAPLPVSSANTIPDTPDESEVIEDNTTRLIDVIHTDVTSIREYLESSDKAEAIAKAKAEAIAKEKEESKFAMSMGNRDEAETKAELVPYDADKEEEPKKESFFSKIFGALGAASAIGPVLKIAGVALAGLFGAGLLQKFFKSPLGEKVKTKVSEFFSSTVPWISEKVGNVIHTVGTKVVGIIKDLDWNSILSTIGDGLNTVFKGIGIMIDHATHNYDNQGMKYANGTEIAAGVQVVNEVNPETGEMESRTVWDPISRANGIAAQSVMRSAITGGPNAVITAGKLGGKAIAGLGNMAWNAIQNSKAAQVIGSAGTKLGLAAHKIKFDIVKANAKYNIGERVSLAARKVKFNLDKSKIKFGSKHPAISSAITKLKTSFKSAVEKFVTGVAERLKINKALDAVKDKFFKLVDGEKVTKFLEENREKLSKQLAETEGKVAAKNMLLVAFAAMGTVAGGFYEARELFGVHEGDLDATMRIVSAAINGILSADPTGISAILDIIIGIVYDLTDYNLKREIAIAAYEALCKIEGKDIDDVVKDLNRKLNDYSSDIDAFNKATGNNYSKAQYEAVSEYNSSDYRRMGYEAAVEWADSIQNPIGRVFAQGITLGYRGLNALTQDKLDAKRNVVSNTRNITNSARAAEITSGMRKEDQYTNKSVENMSVENVGNGYGDARSVGFGNSTSHHYSQLDSTWRNINFGKTTGGMTTTIGSGGCGPTALANVARSLTGNKKITPTTVASMAQDYGYTANGGSAASLFTEGASRLGLTSQRIDVNDIPSRIAAGQKVIVSGKKTGANSPYTQAGHIISLDGVKGGKAIVDDPLKSNTETRNVNDVLSGAKKAWVIGNGSVGYGYSPEEYVNNMVSMGYGYDANGNFYNFNGSDFTNGLTDGELVDVMGGNKGVYYMQGSYETESYAGKKATKWNNKKIIQNLTYRSSGCLPTAFASALSSVTKLDIDPLTIIKLFGKHWDPSTDYYKWTGYQDMLNYLYPGNDENKTALMFDAGFADRNGNITVPEGYNNLSSSDQRTEAMERVVNTLKQGGSVWIDAKGTHAKIFNTVSPGPKDRSGGHGIALYGYLGGTGWGHTSILDPGRGRNYTPSDYSLDDLMEEISKGGIIRRITTFPNPKAAGQSPQWSSKIDNAVNNGNTKLYDGIGTTSYNLFNNGSNKSGIDMSFDMSSWAQSETNIDPSKISYHYSNGSSVGSAAEALFNNNGIGPYAHLYNGYKYMDQLNTDDDSFFTKLGNFATMLSGIAGNIMESILGGKAYESVFGKWSGGTYGSTGSNDFTYYASNAQFTPNHKYAVVIDENGKELYVDVGDVDLSDTNTLKTIATDTYLKMIEGTPQHQFLLNNPKELESSVKNSGIYDQIKDSVSKDMYANGKYHHLYPEVNGKVIRKAPIALPAWYDSDTMMEALEAKYPKSTFLSDYEEARARSSKLEDISSKSSEEVDEIWTKVIRDMWNDALDENADLFDGNGNRVNEYDSEAPLPSSANIYVPSVVESARVNASKAASGSGSTYASNPVQLQSYDSIPDFAKKNVYTTHTTKYASSSRMNAKAVQQLYEKVIGMYQSSEAQGNYSQVEWLGKSKPTSGLVEANWTVGTGNYDTNAAEIFARIANAGPDKIGQGNVDIAKAWASKIRSRSPYALSDKAEMESFLSQPTIAPINKQVQDALAYQYQNSALDTLFSDYDTGLIIDPRGVMQAAEFSPWAPAYIPKLGHNGQVDFSKQPRQRAPSYEMWDRKIPSGWVLNKPWYGGTHAGVVATLLTKIANSSKGVAGHSNRMYRVMDKLNDLSSYPPELGQEISKAVNMERNMGLLPAGYGEAEGYGDIDLSNTSVTNDSSPSMSRMMHATTIGFGGNTTHDNHRTSMSFATTRKYAPNFDSHDKASVDVNVDLRKVESQQAKMVNLLESIAVNTKQKPITSNTTNITNNNIHETNNNTADYGEKKSDSKSKNNTVVVNNKEKINNNHTDRFRELHQMVARSPRSV